MISSHSGSKFIGSNIETIKEMKRVYELKKTTLSGCGLQAPFALSKSIIYK
jgi:hypothetical protein